VEMIGPDCFLRGGRFADVTVFTVPLLLGLVPCHKTAPPTHVQNCAGLIEESLPREMAFALPVVCARAVLVDKQEKNGVYRWSGTSKQRRGGEGGKWRTVWLSGIGIQSGHPFIWGREAVLYQLVGLRATTCESAANERSQVVEAKPNQTSHEQTAWHGMVRTRAHFPPWPQVRNRESN
jgi:hypothetical protein